MTSLNIEKKGDYAIVRIDNGKVNAINLQLATDLRDAFLALGKDTEVKGVILTGRPHCFSAGLDVVDLATQDTEHALSFWAVFSEALQLMIRYPKPFVCAISGYAPAAATILALCADYRIMGRGAKHRIGMHEFKMSLVIPELFADMYAYHMGEKASWEAVQIGKLFNSDEAVKVGLVNESTEVEAVLERAEEELKRRMKVYLPVYSTTKQYFRKGLLQIVDRDIASWMTPIEENLRDPATIKMTRLFLATLKK